jgi:flagellar basal-body rod modification protein FlgD
MINSISNAAQTATASASNSKEEAAIQQADFLKLLATELKNQDPDKPMDSGAMLDQFATLSQVQSMASLETNMVAMTSHQMNMAPLTGASLIGKGVTFQSNDFDSKDATVNGYIEPQQGASEVTVNLRNGLGQIVDSLVIPTSDNKVAFPFKFEGVEEGSYTVEAVYLNDEIEEPVPVLKESKVESIRIDGGEMLFKLSNGLYARLEDLSTINN